MYMNKEEFTINALQSLNIPLKSPTGKSIVNLILLGYREAGWSAGGASKLSKKYFPDKPKSQPIFTKLLLLLNKSYCSKCYKVLDPEHFHSNKSNPTGLQNMCKHCVSVYRRENVDTTYYNAKRRAEERQAIPPWANLNKIKGIYDNCPLGYHVDHIFPLNGENICGLHVETNLQYLLAEDNMRKGNKMPVSTSGEATCFTRSLR